MTIPATWNCWSSCSSVRATTSAPRRTPPPSRTWPPRSSPDVIVTDVTMPGVDGYALAVGLKTDPRTRRIPLLFVTARGHEGDREGVIAGAAGCLAKPFSTSDLIAAIESLRDAAAHEEDPR